MTRFSIVKGDITRLSVMAIVNAANESLSAGGGVDGAIHAAAGVDLQSECSALGGCPTGHARLTGGYRLRAEYIIHTVGPIWRGGGNGESALLGCCYSNVLSLAVKSSIYRLAFPSISTGAYGFPKDRAARIAVGICRLLAAPDSPFEEVIFCLYEDESYELYKDCLADVL